MSCEQREKLRELIAHLQARGLPVRIGWIDCPTHGQHALHSPTVVNSPVIASDARSHRENLAGGKSTSPRREIGIRTDG